MMRATLLPIILAALSSLAGGDTEPDPLDRLERRLEAMIKVSHRIVTREMIGEELDALRALRQDR